jgi:hypothetical protein
MKPSVAINLLIFIRLLFKMKNSRIHEPPNDIGLYKSFFVLLKIF